MNDPGGAPWKRRAGGALLFLFGCAVSLYYGRRGYMPLDQSIVFDGGWRVLCGQVPFRDYHAPNGFAVHALQALFFAAGGVSWLSYCLHAAVVNGLFALLVQRLLVGFGLGARASALWGALSALALYPPIGVPYMEQHAFFFSFAAVAWAIDTRRTEDRGLGARQGSWMALPAVLLLAGLSKQIPSAFAIPIVLAVALSDRRVRAVRRARALAGGSALALGALLLWGWWAGVDLERLDTYFRRLPAEEGARRLEFVPGVEILERMRYTGERLGLGVVDVVHVAAGIGALALIAYPLLRRRSRAREWLLAPLAPLLLAEALLALCLLFVALTSNQPEIGVPYVFVAAGLVHVGLERTRGSLLALRRVWLALWPRLIAAGLVALGVVDGWHFTSTVNATRGVNDIAWDPEVAGLAAPQVPAALGFLRWQVPPPPLVPYGPRDLREVASYLEEQGSPFLLIGDASILYGLTGQPSAAPSLWFHPGLTLPNPDDGRFASYEELIVERIAALGVRFVVLEGEHTWIHHLTLESFPRLRDLVERRRVGSERFGPFEVIDLGA